MNFISHIAQYMYGPDTMNIASSNSDVHANISGAAAFTIIFVCLIIALIGYVIVALLVGRIFKKAGVPQWIAWVPFYNTWKTLELGDQKGFWAVLMVIPIISYVALVFFYIAMYRIGLKFGKENWFVVLGIFIPIVWYGWLALDDSKWNPKAIK